MNKRLKINNKGFTIVETLIVLAIAGLILLIVLLAVPALQRSSQNTNIKTDAEAIASAVNDFESNNGGILPNKITNTSGALQVTSTSGTPVASNGKLQGSTYVNYTSTTGYSSQPTYNPATAQGSLNTVAPGYILIWIGYECPVSGSTSVTASNSAVAIFYPINNGGGSTGGVGCLQS